MLIKGKVLEAIFVKRKFLVKENFLKQFLIKGNFLKAISDKYFFGGNSSQKGNFVETI